MIKFEFTKKDFDIIKDKCMLNEELTKVLEYRIKGYSNTQIALKLGMSERTLSRRIKQIDNKIKKVI